MNRVTVNEENGLLVHDITEVRVRFNGRLDIQRKNLLNPLVKCSVIYVANITSTAYFFHCLQCAEVTGFLLALGKCEVNAQLTSLGHTFCSRFWQ